MSTVVSDEKATAKTAPKEYKQFIGGEWVGASRGATYPDRNPFTGETMATIPASAREDARRAVKAAADAFPAWWKTPPGAKQRLFLRAADSLERRQVELVGLLATETGCPTSRRFMYISRYPLGWTTADLEEVLLREVRWCRCQPCLLSATM